MTESAVQGLSDSDRAAVRAQLDRILRSSTFQQSPRRQRFLEFVVNETLEGRGGRLKGYTIAVEVFGRPASFDPLVDPVVRIEAGRLRERLREYYADGGSQDPIHIELSKGSYAPVIEFRRTAAEDRVPEPSEALVSVTGRLRPLERLPVVAAVAAVASLVVMLGTVAFWPHSPAPAPPVANRAAAEAPRQGPVIAVLPFSNLSGDPKQEYFSDGLTEDILTELSRTRDISVVARNLTFDLKGQPADVAKLRQDLKADYVLEGSVQRSGDHLRVTAQLVDTDSGRHIWADRFDREMSDVLIVQDELVSEIIAKLTGGFGVIEVAESRSAKRKSADEVEAYDLVLRAQDVMRPEWSRKTFGAAKAMLREAIGLDPVNARAHRELAYLSALGGVFRFDSVSTPPQEITAQAVKSVQLAPADARARMVAAAAYFWTGQLDLFEHEAKQALDLAPYDAEILATVGTMIAKSGQWERGVPMVERAYALNAYAATGWYQSTKALEAYLKGDYEHALAFLRQSTDQGTFYVYLEYIPIYGQLGRRDDALAAWRKLLEEEPTASIDTFKSWYRLWNTREADLAKFLDGVEKSGILHLH